MHGEGPKSEPDRPARIARRQRHADQQHREAVEQDQRLVRMRAEQARGGLDADQRIVLGVLMRVDRVVADHPGNRAGIKHERGDVDAPALLLYAGSIAWVIGYDTIYAHQDREDDALIGVKSTARLFGQRTRLALLCFYALAVVLIGLSGAAAGAGPIFVIGCVFFGAHLGWQIERLDIDDPDLCLKLFKSNRDAGLILFAALIGDALYNSYFF